MNDLAPSPIGLMESETGSLGIEQIVGDKRRKIVELAQRHGVTNVRVFGSVARGEARPDSDIDLLVDVDPDVGWELALLHLELEDLLGRTVDLIPADDLREHARPGALRDAVML